MPSDRLPFSVLTTLWSEAVEHPRKMPPVSEEADLANYRKECCSAIIERVELLRTQSALFDLAGIEYKSLARRFIPNRFRFEPYVFLAPERTSDPEIRNAYSDKTTFPFLEILHKHWFHVLFLADNRDPRDVMETKQMEHMVAVRSPFRDIGVATASAAASPGELTGILRERLRGGDLLGEPQRKYYCEGYGLKEDSLRDVILQSSSITLHLLRKAALQLEPCSQRSILFVPAYIGEGERIGGIVFMGEEALSQEECNGLETATKIILSTFRLIEEAATQHHVLLERERDEIRSFLLTRMRHDIRHPFFESLSFLERLRDKTGILTQTVQAIKDLDSQTSALGKSLRGVMGMIDQTLLSLETGVFADVPLHKIEDSVNEFLDDFRWLFQESMPTGRQLEIRSVKENPTFTYDPAIIREVLTNLVKNAIAYAQGNVVVAAERLDQEHIVISVTDGGPGLPEDVKTRLGMPLLPSSGSSEPTKSMGRGLSICYRLMELHGTRLAYDASYTAGTKFDVTIGPPEARKQP